MSKRWLSTLLVVLAQIGAAQAGQRCIQFPGLCETVTLNTDDVLVNQLHGIVSTAACGIPEPDVVISGTFVARELRLARPLDCTPSRNIYYVFDLEAKRAFTYLQDGVESVFVGDDPGTPFTMTDGACPAPGRNRQAPKPSLRELMLQPERNRD